MRLPTFRTAYLLFVLFSIIDLSSIAQDLKITGQIKNSNQENVPYVLIQLNEDSLTVITDEFGKYTFNNLTQGEYKISVNAIGYETYNHYFTINKSTTKNITLKTETTSINEVLIDVKSKQQEIKEAPYAVSVIDTEPLKSENLDLNQVLNKTAGIRIREEGGLGSNFNFSLNGFSGSQVKFFIDGVPMDNFGSSLSLNNLPVNLITRIEVYKGVVPIELGSDALGGAINIVTNKKTKNFLDLSYSAGSFNTHRASIISRVVNKKTGIILNTNLFYNYSDNNYKVEVEIPDPETGKYGDPVSVERFHDQYHSQTLQLEGGVVGKKYADRLFIGLLASSNYKEIQTGSNLTKVSGEVFTEDQVFIPSIKYKKSDLFIKGLTANLYANYNIRDAFVVDTSSKVYDWNGNYSIREIDVTAGELNWDKTLFQFEDKSSLISTNLSYKINKIHSLGFNNNFSSYSRVGKDPISYNAVPFKFPNILQKNISGIAYNLNLFKGKLKSSAFGKAFSMNAKSYDDASGASSDSLNEINHNSNNYGYGFASTYFINKRTQVKASYENTYRLPSGHEMFGNGLLLLNNPFLTPEKSKNFNIGLLTQYKKGKHEFLFEAEYLYRLPTDLIRILSIGITSKYENLTTSRANIFEGGFKYSYKKLLKFSINGTYQNIVNYEEFQPSGGVNYLYLDRLPNTPYLFGNATLGFQFKNIGFKNTKLAINWSTAFVEQFYLKWPSLGSQESKFIVPQQIAHNTSIVYAMKNGRYNISLSCTNVFNKTLYDNFKLQKPGRAFSLKLRCFLEKRAYQ